MPAYNRADVLPRAIDSVLAQTYDDFELIIVDDGSTDETEDVVRSYDDPRIEYIRFDSNRGANAARKAGVEAAEGQYVAFLDSDDKWLSEKIERQVQQFEAAPSNVGLVYTGVRFVNDSGETVAVSEATTEGNVATEMLCDNFVGTFSAAMVDTDLIDEVGLPDSDLDSGQDWEYFTRCALAAQFGTVPEPLVVYITDQNNRISENHVPEEKYETYQSLYQTEIASYGTLTRRKIRSCHSFGLGYSNVQMGKYGKATTYFSQSVKYYPFDIKYYIWLVLSIGGEASYTFARDMKRRLSRLFHK